MIVASVPSSLEVNGREDLHALWVGTGAQIPDRTCYFAGADCVLPAKEREKGEKEKVEKVEKVTEKVVEEEEETLAVMARFYLKDPDFDAMF